MFLATVVVDTYGEIANRDLHVGQPLARIVTQAFAFAIESRERIPSDATRIVFREGITLTRGNLVEITIATNLDDRHIRNFEAVRQSIAASVHHSGMFNCRHTKGAVSIQIRPNVRHLAPTEA